MKQNLKKFTTRILTALVASFGLSVANAADWSGTTSTDWNEGSNWSGGTVPTGQDAVVNNTSGNTATISGNISVTPNDIIVRNGSRIDHLAGSAGTGAGNWMKVENGTYNLANTAAAGSGISGFAQGTGSLNANSNLLVGAWGDNLNGTINVNTTGTFAVSGELYFGDSTGSQGALNLQSGTMTVNNKIFVGNNRGTGTMTMSGGTLTKTGGDQTFVGRDNGTGTLTQSGGTVSLNHDFYVGQGGGGNGTLNLSGSAVLNTGRDFVIGRESGTGTLNMTGGTITKTGDEKFLVGHNNGVGTVVQSGGTISANNELYIGNENSGARGTYTLSGTGALNVAKEVVVGRQSGTGTLTQSGGTVTLNHNLYVGQSSGSTGTYNISGSSVLNVGRDFVIGRESGTGSLNMTGGTITKTGDEKFLVGHNNGVGTVVQSGGTISANNELYIGNENSGARGTYTLSGTGALNVANEVVVGRESGTGILNVDGGTITTTGNGNMYVGRRNGTGTLNQTDGTIVVNKEFGVGTRDDNKIGTGTYNLSGGSIAVANNFFVGKEQGASGTMSMTGGTLGTSESLRIGHNQATGVLTQSGGTVNVQNEVYIGNENSGSSVGTYTLSGTGAVNVGNEVHIGRDNATGTLNLNGGTLMTKKLEGGNGSATVNFNGGVLKAKENQDNLIQNLDVANVQSGGAKINSNGFNVATSQALTGTGGLEKLGAGSLTLSANNTYAGTTTVSEGLLKVNGSVGSIQVNSGASLGGSGTTGSLLVNGTLTPGNSPGTLNTGSQTWFNGANYNWQIFDATGSAGSGYDLLNISGSLDLSNLTAGGFGINMWSLSGINPDVNGNATNFNAANNYSWILAQAAAGITGFEATDFSIFTSAANGTAGFSNTFDGALSIAVAGNNLVLNYQAVPEPSSAALTLLGLVSTLALARRRR